MKRIVVVGLIALTFVGCASLKQAKDDVTTGYTAPLAEGEQSPLEKAQPIADATTSVVTTTVPITAPFAMPINKLIAGAAALFFAWQRGRQIRKDQPVSTHPVTGFAGNQVGIESVVQAISTVSQGVTELFHEGSSAQHAWQGILTGVAGVFGTTLAVPQIAAVVASHPQIYLWIGGIAGAVNFLQQALTKIKPVHPAPTV